MLVCLLFTLATGEVGAQHGKGFYASLELGANFAPSIRIAADANGRGSICDEHLNPFTDLMPASCGDPNAPGTAWSNGFGGANGFMGGLRRSEVSALEWRDVADATDGEGVLITVRTSKTNQEGDAADVRYLKNGAAKAIRTLRTDRPDAAPTDRVIGLSPLQIQRRFTAAARAAGIEFTIRECQEAIQLELVQIRKRFIDAANTLLDDAALAVFGWRCVQRFRHYLDQSIEAETDMPMAYRSAMFAAVLSWLISFLAVMGLSFLIQHLLAETSYQDIVNAVFGVMLLGLVATNLCLLYEVMRVAWRWIVNR